MNIDFQYDIDKDVDNFLVTLSSQNNKQLTKFQNQYIQRKGTVFDKIKVKCFIENYIDNQELDLYSSLDVIMQNWKIIEEEFKKKAEKIFSLHLNLNLTIFITTNNRCSYNIRENYFYVYFNSKNSNAIIMHELLHFYTWHSIRGDFLKQGFTMSQYNDLKESLTDLLNIEFYELMNGAIDSGYIQHSELRLRFRQEWLKCREIKTVIEELYYKKMTRVQP
jgi:hypothetical protein